MDALTPSSARRGWAEGWTGRLQSASSSAFGSSRSEAELLEDGLEPGIIVVGVVADDGDDLR